MILLAIPATLTALAALLWFSAFAENHLVSPQAIVIRVCRDRRRPPDAAEAIVAHQLERLLSRNP